MKQPILCGVLVLFCLGVGGCKGPEDWLTDLNGLKDDKGHLRIEVYDAGQTAFEAFAGLSTADSLSLSQMSLAVALAGRYVEQSEVALLRQQAVHLLGRLAARWPIAAVDSPYAATPDSEVRDVALANIDALTRILVQLEVESRWIPGLRNPDRAVVELSLQKLREASGQDLGRKVEAWETWWESRRAQITASAAHDAEAPLTVLADTRFATLGQAQGCLLCVGVFAARFDPPELRPLIERAALHLARQTVVHGINYALKQGGAAVRREGADAGLRGEAADAARAAPDPSYGENLVYALLRERDVVARLRIMAALVGYPRKDVIEALLTQMRDDERAIAERARRVLIGISNEDLGVEPAAWDAWWVASGKQRWP